MSVRTEIDRISAAVQNAHLKVIEKGGSSAAPYLVENLASAISTIPKSSGATLQSKSVTPTESDQTVKPDSGYDGLSSVSVGAISKTYIGSSISRQAAQTITPGTADKTIASGKYLTGTQTIKGDANLVAGNIKSGVSIFGVAGSYAGSGTSGSGGAQIATGTFTPVDVSLMDIPVVVSGLGFKPKAVYIYAAENQTVKVSGSLSTTIQANSNYETIFWSESDNIVRSIKAYAYVTSDGSTGTLRVKHFPEEGLITFNATSDGFTMSGFIPIVTLSNCAYNYIAIG